MNNTELSDFNKANKKKHSVTDHWAHKYLIKAGFKPMNDDQVGFVRTYKFQDDKGRVISASTGSSSDYWSLEEGWEELAKTDEFKKLTSCSGYFYWAGLKSFTAWLVKEGL